MNGSTPRAPAEVPGPWLDVTRALAPGHPNWPGDTPLTLTATARKAAGDSVNVMALTTSTHLGTHLDAPYHYDEDGGRLEAVPLGDLLGPCLVLDVRDAGVPDGAPVTAEVALAALERVSAREPRASARGPRASARDPRAPARVLLRTGQPDAWDTFPQGFRPLSEALVEALAGRGVRLLGTDAPSVDAFTSKVLPVHATCAREAVWIVEGLALARVEEGAYELVCLPLRLIGADASPVRALLRPLSGPS